ncbi:hypothetical protein CcrSwift_gp172 [Caulobacter phage CcrSwift]|uniref:Uncharacterized protein n=1 Tax=Caulobacter phage CcrSwift TaxID=2927984 RepID=K4JVQ8_9CAUD|nr:hypothetical protein CcrMagneto_gp173 [Caulobacter virus Magneto]YP_006989905.1 hypothetical protein D870_gp249 [Caulobacter phage CcrSwift]AFU87343.1 hypothetical protein CcrMagneto_gp173 [Caulobacter virus Magneto]AFU88490.1 hypothetical protein CcrSwift_gp172 [Caulobacter phage CcrSwift]
MNYIIFSIILGVVSGLVATIWTIKHESRTGVLKLADAAGAVALGFFTALGMAIAWPLGVPGFLIALAIWYFVNKGKNADGRSS